MTNNSYLTQGHTAQRERAFRASPLERAMGHERVENIDDYPEFHYG